jgi:hypothetical protein
MLLTCSSQVPTAVQTLFAYASFADLFEDEPPQPAATRAATDTTDANATPAKLPGRGSRKELQPGSS